MDVLYNFGQSQEDEKTEAAALQLNEDDHVLSIASAGDMPLSLAAMGAGQITAVDVSMSQLALTQLKLAAVHQMPREEAIRFLGYLPMKKKNRWDLFQSIETELPEADRSFWRSAPQAIKKGVIWEGRFERYLRYLRPIVVMAMGKRHVSALFDCQTIEEQKKLFDQFIGRPRMKWIFRKAFDPKRFSGKGMDPRSLAHRTSEIPLGEQYFGWFRAFCTNNLASENHFLQLTLLGRVLNPDVVPTYLTSEGYQVLCEHRNKIVLHKADIAQYLTELSASSFTKAHLSNICDWMDQASFDKVMGLLVEKCVENGRLVWRFLHVDRLIPPQLTQQIVEDRAMGQQNRLAARALFRVAERPRRVVSV